MISGSELARRAGISRQAVHNLIKANKLPVILDVNGRPQFDETSPEIQTYIAEGHHQRRAAVGSRAGKTAEKQSSVGAPSLQLAGSDPLVPGMAEMNGQRPLMSWKRNSDGGESYNEAERRKKIADADMAELKAAERRGELVERASVDKVFNQCWAIDASRLLTISQRIAADLAAVFGVDDGQKVTAAQELLDLEIRGALGQSKKLLMEWLQSQEAEGAA